MARYATPFALTAIVLMSTAPARAQQVEPTSPLAVAADQLVTAAVVEDRVSAAMVGRQTETLTAFTPAFTSPKAPAWFMGVHAVTAGLQALDGYSTARSLRSGASEANPLLAPLASNRPVLWATKAAVAAGVIVATNGIAKRHRVAALVTAIAVNGAYAAIIAHNYRVARSAPPR